MKTNYLQELEAFKNELGRLSNAVSYIEKAKETALIAIDSLGEIEELYREHLDRVEELHRFSLRGFEEKLGQLNEPVTTVPVARAIAARSAAARSISYVFWAS